MNRTRLLIVAACSATIVAAMPARAQGVPSGQDGLTLAGTTRLRYEWIAGQPRAGFDTDDDLLDLRTTLAIGWSRDGWRAGAEVYDSRAYLADAGTPLTTGEVNALELAQAYIARDIAFGRGEKLSVQAGRFLMNLGSRRLVAADDYRNTTNSYTGLRADLTTAGGIAATAVYTLPQQRRPDDADALRRNAVGIDREGFDLVLWGGLLTRSRTIGAATVQLSAFHLGERDAPTRPTRDRSLNTLGVRIEREPGVGAFDYEAEGFVQRGRISASAAAGAASLAVSATFIHLEAGYNWRGRWRPRLSVEYDRASGDAPGGRYGRFDTLFGMRRADLAPSGLYNAVGRANISSPALRLEVAPTRRIDAFVSLRPMWLASRTDPFSTTSVRDPSGAAGNYAGGQVDARVRLWAIPERLRLEIDGVYLRKGRFLHDAPNAPDGGDTRYLSVNATTSF